MPIGFKIESNTRNIGKTAVVCGKIETGIKINGSSLNVMKNIYALKLKITNLTFYY